MGSKLSPRRSRGQKDKVKVLVFPSKNGKDFGKANPTRAIRLCGKTRPLLMRKKEGGRGQDGLLSASPFAAHLRTAQCASRRACGQVHKGAEAEEHAGRLVLSPLRARSSSSWLTAAALRLLSKIYESEAAAPQGISMTELGKKRLLIVVDVLCVFVGE